MSVYILSIKQSPRNVELDEIEHKILMFHHLLPHWTFKKYINHNNWFALWIKSIFLWYTKNTLYHEQCYYVNKLFDKTQTSLPYLIRQIFRKPNAVSELLNIYVQLKQKWRFRLFCISNLWFKKSRRQCTDILYNVFHWKHSFHLYWKSNKIRQLWRSIMFLFRIGN